MAVWEDVSSVRAKEMVELFGVAPNTPAAKSLDAHMRCSRETQVASEGHWSLTTGSLRQRRYVHPLRSVAARWCCQSDIDLFGYSPAPENQCKLCTDSCIDSLHQLGWSRMPRQHLPQPPSRNSMPRSSNTGSSVETILAQMHLLRRTFSAS